MTQSTLSESNLLRSSAAGIVVNGTSGDDYLHGSAGNDTINGLDGSDGLYGDDGNDILNGGGGNDYLSGGSDNGADKLNGGSGNDTLNGGAGNDVLDGGTGNDTMSGDWGDDTYLFGVGSGQDAVSAYYDDDGHNRVLLGNGIGTDDVTLSRTKVIQGSLTLSINGTSDQITIDGFFFEFGGSFTLEFADGTRWGWEDIVARIPATEGDDLLTGSHGDDVLSGLGGDDYIYGVSGDDVVFGGAGQDYIHGDAGDDTLDGGTGNDILIGNAGNDTYLFGRGSGQDTIYNEEDGVDVDGTDRLVLGDGITAADIKLARAMYGDNLLLTIKGGDDKLTVYDHFWGDQIDFIEFADGTVWNADDIDAHILPTDGKDYLEGTSGNDTINGLGGQDKLFGVGGNDTLDGGDGGDLLRGGDGNDVLVGGAGNDKLHGESGNDVLTGGAGADAFFFDGWLSASNVDTIVDFQSDDVIKLENRVFSKLLPRLDVPADSFVASASGNALDANDYILYDTDSGALYYDADGNGAGVRVQFAVIGTDAHPALTADDFLVV